MAGGDPYQEQWNLRPRIDALRAEAKSLHKQVAERFTERTTEVGVARDRAARDQFAAEQAAKSADIQVGVERKAVASADKEIATREQQIAAAERRGDRAGAEELREDVGKFAADRAAHAARARQAELDAAQLRDEAAGHQRHVTELNVERQDVVDASRAAEGQIDKMDDQVRLLEQARLKYAEADMATDAVKRSTLELEAEALVTSAGAIEIDRNVLRVIVPDLPETTPNIDADPGPLPPGSEDASSMTEPAEDDAVASTDEQPSADGTAASADDQALAPTQPADDWGEVATDAVTAGGDSLGLDAFTDTAGGQSFEISGADATFVSPDSNGLDQIELDATNEPAASFDGSGASTDFDTDTFEPAAAADPFAGDALGGGTEDSFASTDFEAPVDSGMDFASTDTFETESFEA